MAAESDVVVNIIADVNKFKRGLASASKGLKGFAKSTADFVRQNKLAILGATVAVGAFAFKAVKAASDLEETQAKFNTVFRTVTEEAEKSAQILQDSFLLSERAAKANLAAIQDTLVPMGLMRSEAQNISFEVVKLAADLGSFNNLPTEQVMRDIQSALVGNFETMKKYGVVLRATDVQNRILNKGIAKSASEITNAQRVTEAYKLILEGTEDAQGDVARTSESFANQTKKLNAEFEDFMATVGEFVLGPGTDLVRILTKLVGLQKDALKTIQKSNKETGSFGETIKRAAVQALTELAQSSETVRGSLILMGVNVEQLNQKWQMNFDNMRVAAKKTSDQVKKGSKAVTETVIEEVNLRTQHGLIKSDERIQQAIKEGAEKNALSEIEKEVSILNTETWTDFAKDASNQVFTQFGQGIADMILEGRRFSDVMKSIWKSLARTIISEITRMLVRWLAFRAVVGAFGGGVASVLFQHGGIIGEPTIMKGMISGQTAIAGEAGPEMIVPAKNAGGGGLKPFGPGGAPSLAGAGGGGGVTINISGQFLEGSPTKWSQMFREKLMPEIRRFTMISPTSQFNRKRGAA